MQNQFARTKRSHNHYDNPRCDNPIRGQGMKLWCIVFIASCAVFCSGQDVHTEPVKDGVNLSISAQQSYEIIAGEKKRPTLSIQCSQNQKGTKVVHLVMFSAGGSLAEDNPETTPKNGEIGLKTQIGSGTEQMTNWIPYGDGGT